ncbi:MAG: hypothetical protein ACPGYY_05060 [Bacteroidia bacterium]
MKALTLAISLFIYNIATAQKIITSFSELPKKNANGVLNLEENGFLFFNTVHPATSTKKMKAKSTLNLAFVTDGKVIWEKSIIPEDNFKNFENIAAVSSDKSCSYFLYRHNRAYKWIPYIIYKVSNNGEIEKIEITENEKISYIQSMHCTEDAINFIAPEYTGPTSIGTLNGNEHHEQLFKLSYNLEKDTFAKVKLNLPQISLASYPNWNVVGVSKDKMYFFTEANTIASNKRATLVRIAQINPDGTKRKEDKIILGISDRNPSPYRSYSKQQFNCDQRISLDWYNSAGTNIKFNFEEDIMYLTCNESISYNALNPRAKYSVYQSTIKHPELELIKTLEFKYTKNSFRTMTFENKIDSDGNLYFSAYGHDLYRVNLNGELSSKPSNQNIWNHCSLDVQSAYNDQNLSKFIGSQEESFFLHQNSTILRNIICAQNENFSYYGMFNSKERTFTIRSFAK